MTKTICFFTALITLTSLKSQVWGGGFMIPHQTARGVGLSNALTAGVNDPSAVYYNPAALSEISGNNVLGSGTYINLINSVENSGRTATNKHDDNFLASFFANYHVPGSNFTVGVGTYTPFGLATTYEEDFTRFAAKRSELRTIYVTPAASWKPSQYFSVGAGLSFVHASGMFTRALCLNPGGCGAAPDPGEATLRLTDTTNAFTYNLGVLVKPLENWKFGFGYRGRTDLRFNDADVKLGGPALPAMKVKADVKPLALPPVINAGMFWQITPSWGTEFVYEYARWSEFKSLKASFESGPLPGFSLPQDWKNTSTFRLGTYYTLNNWELLGGLALEETPIPNKTLNPAIPGGDTLTLNAGIEYKWERFSMGLGYMAVFYKTRKVSNTELEGLPATGLPFTGAPGKDTYRTYDNFVTVSLGYRF